MIKLASLRDDMDAVLAESDLNDVYGITMDLWDELYNNLTRTDKRLRDQVGELYILSTTILRSLDNGTPD
jgi:hypothetical protein